MLTVHMAKTPTKWNPADCLQLQDIALWESSFKREKEYQPGLHQGRLASHSRRAARAEILDVEDAQGAHHSVLRAIISLGMRGVLLDSSAEPGASKNEPEVLFQVEADFAVTYEILKTPTDDELHDFVLFNCTHNVWPFWRQHVFQTLKEASLPILPVPLFSGRPDKAAGKVAKKNT